MLAYPWSMLVIDYSKSQNQKYYIFHSIVRDALGWWGGGGEVGGVGGVSDYPLSDWNITSYPREGTSLIMHLFSLVFVSLCNIYLLVTLSFLRSDYERIYSLVFLSILVLYLFIALCINYSSIYPFLLPF